MSLPVSTHLEGEILVPLAALPGDEGCHIAHDPRVRSVLWRDLITVSPWETFQEATLSLPWLVATLGFFGYAQHTANPTWLLAALISGFYLFLTGLRQTHNAFHYAVGLSRRGCDLLMFFLSIVMTGSMHAVQVCHLHHHRTNLGPDDVEGSTARLPWWRALLIGPLFPLMLLRFALRTARPRQRMWIRAELAANLAWYALAFGLLWPVWGLWWPAAFTMTMWLGQSCTGFFAVWTVHHECDRDQHLARTQRGWFKNLISYQMFHHVEHHLFPAVPTCHWPELARRLDEAAPELRTRQVY